MCRPMSIGCWRADPSNPATLVRARTDGSIRPEDQPALEPWARFWHLWVSVTYLKAYLQIAGPAVLPATTEWSWDLWR